MQASRASFLTISSQQNASQRLPRLMLSSPLSYSDVYISIPFVVVPLVCVSADVLGDMSVCLFCLWIDSFHFASVTSESPTDVGVRVSLLGACARIRIPIPMHEFTSDE